MGLVTVKLTLRWIWLHLSLNGEVGLVTFTLYAEVGLVTFKLNAEVGLVTFKLTLRWVWLQSN